MMNPEIILMQLANGFKEHSSLVSKLNLDEIKRIKNPRLKESFLISENTGHQLEEITILGKVKFINDSYSTNINRLWYALENFSPPIILIGGGVEKEKLNGEPQQNLNAIDKLIYKIKAFISLETTPTPFYYYFASKSIPVAIAKTMENAVKIAYLNSKEEDTILLSPGAPSFNLFEDYEDRGNQFAECVRKL